MDDDDRNEPGWRQRLRYWFDNLLARGTWAVLVWLGIVTILVVAFSAFLLWVFRVSYTSDENSSWLEEGWQSLLRVMDPGTMAGDVGWGRRVLALSVTVFGILVAGTLIGVIAAGVEDRVDRMRRGRSEVIERDHVVILGTSDWVPHIVRELVLARPHERPDVIVILADDDPSDVHEAARSGVDDLGDVRIVVRVGDPATRADLRLVRPTDARTIIVLGDEGMGAVRRVLAIGREFDGEITVPVVVEVHDTTLAEQLVRTHGHQVHPIVAAEAVARIAAFSLRQPGLGSVIDELIDSRDAAIQFLDRGDIEDRTPRFGDLVTGAETDRPLGVLTPQGLTINPPAATQLGPHDRLVALTRDPSTSIGEFTAPAGSVEPVAAEPPSVPATDVLVIGWNALGARVVAAWAASADPASRLTIVAAAGAISAWPPDATRIASTTIVETDRRAPVAACREHLSPQRPTAIILLARDTPAPARDVDARTILDLLALRRELATSDEGRRIMIEFLDAGSQELVDLGPDDDLISEAIGSRFVAQLALESRRRDVLLAISRPDGPVLRLVAGSELGIGEGATMADVAAAAYRSGWLTLGWRDTETGHLELAPDLGERLPAARPLEFVLIA